MKNSVIVLALFVWVHVNAQTNNTPPDFRMVNGKIYDVNKSPEWVSLAIPEGARLGNSDDIHFDGTVKPLNIMFLLPPFELGGMPIRGYPLYIENFPYNPASFREYRHFVYLTVPLKLKVLPAGHTSTNYDALGHMEISRPRAFDFGIPTNSVE